MFLKATLFGPGGHLREVLLWTDPSMTATVFPARSSIRGRGCRRDEEQGGGDEVRVGEFEHLPPPPP